MSGSIEITPELMAGFLDEAPEYLEMLDSGLMDLESMAGDGVIALTTPEDNERMNEMFRAAHSLKGLAAAFGFEKIKDLTHHMETLFDHVRMGKKCLYDHSIETLFTVFDRLKELITELTDPDGPAVEIADMVEELKRVLDEGADGGTGGASGESAPRGSVTEAASPAACAVTECNESGTEAGPGTAEGDVSLSELQGENVPVASQGVEAGQQVGQDVQASADIDDGGDALVQSEVFQDPELASLFIETVSESLEELNQGLLGLENQPDDNELLNQIFRSAHNIKGASGAAGLTGMNRVTHNMETVFDKLRNGRTSLEDSLMGALFEAVDRLRAVIDRIRDGQVEDIKEQEMFGQFEPWISADTSAPTPSEPQAGSPSEAEPPEPVDAGDDGSDGTIRVIVTFKAGFDEAPIQAYLIHNKLASMGDILSCDPDIDTLTGDTDLSSLDFLLQTDESPPAVESAVSLFEVDSVTVQGARTASCSSDDIHAAGHESEAAAGAGTGSEPSEIASGLGVQATAATSGAAGGDAGSSATAIAEPSSITAGEAPAPVSSQAVASMPVTGSQTVSPASGSPSTGSGAAQAAASNAQPPAVAPSSSNPSSSNPSPSNPSEAKPAQAGQSSAGGAPATPGGTQPARPASGGDRPRAAGDRKPEQSAVKTGETLRVDLERLDQLMNLGGELVINKARFAQIHGTFREIFDGKNHAYLVDDVAQRLAYLRERAEEIAQNGGNPADAEIFRDNILHLNDSVGTIRSLVERVYDARLAMHDFDEALHGLGRVSEGLQKGIMGTRMVPIGPLFKRFQRVVRDISKACGKKVNFVMHGEQTELDKRMIDELGDPLTHMVRNAVDHGIETPDERLANGKDETGTLTLEACHRGNSICIEVSDDGGGVNVERVRAKVLEKEMATEAQVDRMTDRELIQYILKPGFSTAAKVTDLSGRGMGMDIVVAKLDQLNGSIEIDSKQGEGTKITIRLPLTLAILTSMVANIGQGTYAIPLESVLEIISVRKSDIQRIQRREVVRVRDRVVPLTCFEDVFGTGLPALQTASRSRDELTLVIVGFENDQLGLMVDELLGQEDVVIKSIAENYRNVDGIAGASIRGDGTVALILDIGAMMAMAGESGASNQAEREACA